MEVDLRVGDVQDLDLPAGSFDVVLSVMGMIFAPDHARAMAEMARVCRSGGTVAITSWAAGGWSHYWRRQAGNLIPEPPAGGPAHEEWGDRDEILRRFANVGLQATVVERSFAWVFASEGAALEVLLRDMGPFLQMMEAAATVGKAEAAVSTLRTALAERNIATDGSCVLDAPFFLATAHRR